MDAPVLPMPAPLCLVTNKDDVLSLNPVALAVLRSVTQPLVVVAIAGLYRTGKSFLMNQLAQKRTGFPLGPTVRAETKGIWMWCLPHPRQQGVTLVLLDTEGLGDPNKDDDDSDTWIFTLALLLSSTLVYNSIGTIDQQALEQLRLVTELTKHIRVREEDDNPASNFVRVFPSFVWTVRDFTLQLRAGEKTLSEDEYLEQVLQLQTGNGKKAKERNELRRCLRNFFPRRKLFTMERTGSCRGSAAVGRSCGRTSCSRLPETGGRLLPVHLGEGAGEGVAGWAPGDGQRAGGPGGEIRGGHHQRRCAVRGERGDSAGKGREQCSSGGGGGRVPAGHGAGPGAAHSLTQCSGGRASGLRATRHRPLPVPCLCRPRTPVPCGAGAQAGGGQGGVLSAQRGGVGAAVSCGAAGALEGCGAAPAEWGLRGTWWCTAVQGGPEPRAGGVQAAAWQGCQGGGGAGGVPAGARGAGTGVEGH
uniref:GB1/RHD3-type G domain-containing protein n=1 Tax=Meleagris gallopavo TaxID=9103 RepID=A0A803XVQ0_MELGA